jgi:Na+/melibiose symporter-like transporter
MGNVLSGLFLAIYTSYLLTFQTKVLGLPSSIVGLLWLIPAGIDAFLALFIGYVSDNINIPYVSKFYGKRKSWHLIGCALVGLFSPFLLMRCFVCGDQTDGWEVVVYYVVIMLIAYSGWGLAQSNYLALIPEIATRRSEMVKLGAIRYVLIRLITNNCQKMMGAFYTRLWPSLRVC